MRILVTGSRTWTDTRAIRDALATVWHPRNILVHGGCPTGADMLANACWTHWGGRTEPHQSETVYQPCRSDCRHGRRRRGQYGTYCPAPPQRRNRHMVQLGADICLAFIQSKSSGATETARYAHHAGIPVRIYRTGPGSHLTVPAPRKDSACPHPQLPLPLS